MPIVTLRLTSESGRSVSDEPNLAEIVKGTRYVHPRDIQTAKGLVQLNVVPGTYKLAIRVDGYKPSSGSFSAKANANKVLQWPLTHRATLLPRFGDLDDEAKRLLESFHPGGPDTWKELSENQAATFFQVTYALARTISGEVPLSQYIQRIQRIGGAEIEARHEGELRRAVGWRMHVLIKRWYRDRVQDALLDAGLKKDDGWTHPTHTKFGYSESFRQKGGSPRLQVVLRQIATNEYDGADVDLDVGGAHKSAPHDVYKDFVRRYPEVKGVYRVA